MMDKNMNMTLRLWRSTDSTVWIYQFWGGDFLSLRNFILGGESSFGNTFAPFQSDNHLRGISTTKRLVEIRIT